MNFSDMILNTCTIDNSNLRESELTYIYRSNEIENRLNAFLTLLKDFDTNVIKTWYFGSKYLFIVIYRHRHIERKLKIPY